MKKNVLLLFILVLVQSTCFSQKTYTGTSGNWNVAANWTPSGVPTATDDVIIPSGKTVAITVNASVKSLTISGAVTLADNLVLTIGTNTVFGNFTVNSGGSFSMPSGSGLATLIVYGNYYNYGTTEFWKSNVIIVGDLLSPSSSALQNQGNVVVGGNIIGAFNLTGGTGTNQIYAVNSNATVTITPSSVDNNVNPGTQVTTANETQALVDLVNSILFGSSSCTFTTNDPSNKTICSGTNTTFTVSTPQSNPSYQWQVNTGTGWSDLSNGGVYSGVTTATLTLTNVLSSMNGYKFRAKITAGCSKNGNYAILTVNASPVQPVVSISQPNCSTTTGTITVSIQNASDSYSFDNGVTFQTSNVKSGLSVGSYNVIIKNSSGCTSATTTSTVSQSSTTWNGSSWSPNTPTSNDKIIFNGNYSSVGELVACSCQVISGNVVINSGHTLTLTNELNVSGGTLTFNDAASLVQHNAVTNTGNIIYKRKTTPLKQYDFTYWSTPVNNATLSQLATNAAFFSYSPTISNWVSQPSSLNMNNGIGYIGRAPTNLSYSTPQIVETSFVGVPNNGDITAPIIKSLGTTNLIGNPYPSAIDADLFISDAANSNSINGTIYLWTHNTAITNNNYTQNDYAKYNLIGGVRTASAALSGGVTPNGKIAAGQGFFVEANSNLANGNYSVVFKNSMRIANNNYQFFKSNSANNSVATVKNRFWISVSNIQGAYNEFLVGYVPGATNSFDSLYDGRTLSANNSVSIYTVLENNNLAIQGRALPFENTDSIPIGYSTTINGDLTINLENFEGLFDNQSIFLYDKITGIYHDLKSGFYTFTTSSGTFNDRFEMRFTTSNLTTNSFENGNESVKVVHVQNQLIIASNGSTISDVEIYDMTGKLIFVKRNLDTNEFKTIVNEFSSQLLIVKTILANQQTNFKKVTTN